MINVILFILGGALVLLVNRRYRLGEKMTHIFGPETPEIYENIWIATSRFFAILGFAVATAGMSALSEISSLFIAVYFLCKFTISVAFASLVGKTFIHIASRFPSVRDRMALNGNVIVPMIFVVTGALFMFFVDRLAKEIPTGIF